MAWPAQGLPVACPGPPPATAGHSAWVGVTVCVALAAVIRLSGPDGPDATGLGLAQVTVALARFHWPEPQRDWPGPTVPAIMIAWCH